MTKCPITRALHRLQQFAGLPVPAVVKWIDGKPDFRQSDEIKFAEFFARRLCFVCGTRLTLSCYWVGGGASARSHYFTDGPMHRECAEESIRACPFLAGTRTHFRGDDLKGIPEQANEVRPQTMYLLRGHTSAIEMHQIGPESIALWAGRQLFTVKQF